MHVLSNIDTKRTFLSGSRPNKFEKKKSLAGIKDDEASQISLFVKATYSQEI